MPEQQEVKASLGCGTLILIAVIVIIFGGHRDHDTLERKIDQLQEEVSALREAVEGGTTGEDNGTQVPAPWSG